MSALVVEYFGGSGVRRIDVVGAHPYADRFPMLPEDELQRLAEDIRENGQRNPIMVDIDGLILDGRNRLAACQMLGIEPDFEVCGFEDVAAYILSANVARRHQSTGSRAMSTALVLADDGRRENGRWKRGSVTANPESGITSGKTWQNFMQMAGTILDHAPDLAARVDGVDLLTYVEARDLWARRNHHEGTDR